MNLLFLLADNAGEASQVFFGFGMVGLVIALILSLFWLWMLIDALTSPSLESTMKIVWALVIFFLPFLGALAYFFIGRKGRPGSVGMR